MVKYSDKLMHVLRLGLLLLMALPAWSQAPGQYYFVGYQAPAGSISSAGQNEPVVYLRWDELEGSLPGDVVRIRLIRNNDTANPLLDVPVDAVMPVIEIAALYDGAAQQRRLLETMKNLKELAVFESADFSANNFADIVRGRVDPNNPGNGFTNYDPAWSFLASRNDINIARARYRAFVDTPGTGTFEYELLAVNAGNQTARLGLLTIDTTQPQNLLPPTNFMQVLQSSCDLPGLGMDHYTVALNWEAPGMMNVTDRIAAQVYIGGYDLYRTTDNLDPLTTEVPLRDIRAEAAAAGFDNRGNVTLNGLEKINDVPLTVNSDDDTTVEFMENLGSEDNPQMVAGGLAPEWLETQDQLKLAGLKPGDKRAYYLVPRDFTGNYGPTVATIVVVPNKIRPPAPWELRTFVDQTGALTQPPQTGMAISWDKVNLDNYLDTYNASRRFCNIAEAQSTGVLEFVTDQEDCDEDPRRSIRLDVSDYIVYRFENFADARTFKDSDGDGYADADEAPGGTQCQFNNSLNLPNYAVAATGINLAEFALPSGRETIRFTDLEPQSQRNDVFWYRAAAKTPDGRISLPSAPQRAIFPNRPLPPKPDILMVKPTQVPDGGCELVVDRPDGPWNFREQVDGRPFTVSCPAAKPYILPNLTGPRIANANTQECLSISAACNRDGGANGDPVTLTYPDNPPGPGVGSCSITIPDDLPAGDQGVEFCSQGSVRLVPTYRTEFEAVSDGDVIDSYAILTVPEPTDDTCVTLYENIDSESVKIATSCNSPENIDQIEIVIEQGFFCGYAVAQDSDNNISATQVAPCVEFIGGATKPPATPQPVDLVVDAVRTEFSWRLPVEPVAVTLVRLDQRLEDGTLNRQIISVPAAGAGSGEVTSEQIDIPELVGNRDEWCVSFRAVGPSGGSGPALRSDWSSPRCVERRADNQDIPEYLPWPFVPGAAEGTPLQVGIQTINESSFGQLYVSLYRVSISGGLGEQLFRGCIFRPLQDQTFVRTRCSVATKLAADAALDRELPFMVYRQSERPDGSRGDWIQVSPLLEYAHWDSAAPTDDEPKFIALELRDPYVRLRSSPPDSDSLRDFVFTDRYPVINDYRYRYQLVYFSNDMQIVRWRQSDWITFVGRDLGLP